MQFSNVFLYKILKFKYLRQNMHACLLCHFSHVRLCDPMDCSPPGFSVQVILQARMLEWVYLPSSRGPSWPRDWTVTSFVSCIGRQVHHYQGQLGSPEAKHIMFIIKYAVNSKNSHFSYELMIISQPLVSVVYLTSH